MIEHWGTFSAARIPPDALVVIDERVARLHRIRIRGALRVRAGENLKSLAMLERILEAGTRARVLVAIGGGTVGDLCTVAAHLIKRGIDLIQVPTTALAAVDSSVGGKGAINVAGVKNAAGVFHFATETWLCPELFETLAPAQLREGATEAWKMVACLDARLWRRYRARRPGLIPLIRDARKLKAAICGRDPFEAKGLRTVLNFGHTFGHVLESLSGFRLSHGDGVGLGMLCALDVGRAMRVTPNDVAAEVEAGLREGPGILDRSVMRRWFRSREVERFLAADKKDGRMVLLRRVGRAEVVPVPARVLRRCIGAWRGAR